MRRIFQGIVLLTWAGVVLGLAGCHYGRERLPETGATLDGTVTYGGEPVMVAMIIATGSGPGANGYIDIETGKYRIENVPIGEVKLALRVDAGRAQLQSLIMQGKKMPKIIEVPKKYTDEKTTDIVTTIEKGDNHFDIKIPK
jgi:hypothetical protein